MIVKVQNSGVGGDNIGSCSDLADYLEKENEAKEIQEKDYFFNHTEDLVALHEVKNEIDTNKKNLSAKDTKFYSVIISPSEKELQHIGNDKSKLRDYTREVMNTYAEHFDKGLKGENLVYFAKIENERKIKGFDHQRGKFLEQKQGEKKEGLNTHIHVIVSRNSNQNATTKSGKQIKLSPQIKQKSRTWKKDGVTRKAGFDRLEFCNKVEKCFDKKFDYKRELGQKFEYQYAKKNGNIQELETLEKKSKKAVKTTQKVILKENEHIKKVEIKEELKKEIIVKKDKGMSI